MRCLYCLNDTKVVDKRDVESITRRRRECLKCEKRFTTHEKVQININIVKKSGNLESYSFEKLKQSMIKAIGRDQYDFDALEKSVCEIESKIIKSSSKNIKSEFIGKLVLKKLLKLDKIAYLRYKSIHGNFENLKEVEQEVKMIR